MEAATAGNAKVIEIGQDRIRAEQEQLDPEAPDYREESNRLMQAFHAVEKDIPAQPIVPVLRSFLQQQSINESL